MRPTMLATFTAVLLPCLALASLTGQQDPPPSKARGIPGHGFVLEEGDIGIAELIDGAAAFLNRNILYNPMEMKGAAGQVIHIQRRLELDAIGCEEMLSTLLYSQGFALTPLDPERGVYEVLGLNGPRGREVAARAVWMTPEEILKRPNLRTFVLTTVDLQHINATVATNALRPFFSSQGGHGAAGTLTLGNVGNNRAILFQGFRDQVAMALRMLQQVDQPDPDRPPDLEQRLQQLEARVQTLHQTLSQMQAGKK